MDFYIDVRIKPTAEMRENVLLSKVYSKLHKALHDINSNDIGVSFPESHVTLGKVIRLHASEQRLKELQELSWPEGLQEYCNISPISPIPAQVAYRKVSRIQSSMTNSKLKRLLKRGRISKEQVKSYRIKMFHKSLSQPYLELVSNSNGHRHRRYIEQGKVVCEPTPGLFDTFGLSKEATIPYF